VAEMHRDQFTNLYKIYKELEIRFSHISKRSNAL